MEEGMMEAAQEAPVQQAVSPAEPAPKNADYIPFYRVKEGLAAVRSARNNSGLAGQSSGIKT